MRPRITRAHAYALMTILLYNVCLDLLVHGSLHRSAGNLCQEVL